MDRAARRRAIRATGVKRARGKKGRRAELRVGHAEANQVEALERAGFVVARPSILGPDGKKLRG